MTCSLLDWRALHIYARRLKALHRMSASFHARATGLQQCGVYQRLRVRHQAEGAQMENYCKRQTALLED